MAASTYFAQVQQLYIAYFGRPADPTGQAYWAANIDAAKGDISAVIAGFSASNESQELFGNKSTIDKVNAIYQNAFGRAPEPAGLAYWVEMLDSGKVSQAQASWTIQQNAGPGDAAAVQNKLTAAQAFTAQIDTTAEINGYQGANAAQVARDFLSGVTSDNATATAAVAGAAAALAEAVAVGGVVGNTYVLTDKIDVLTGTANNDLFIGDATTIQAADQINGGAGVDTLEYFGANGATVALPTLTNVERLVLTNADNVIVTAQNIKDLTDVVLKGATAATNTLTVGTGVKVTVDGGAAAQVAIVNFADTAAAASLALTNGANVATLTANGAALKTLNIASNGSAANTIGTLTNTTVNTLNISGVQKLEITNALSANFTTVDASTNTGGVALTFGAADVTVTGGAGNDKFNFGTTLTAADKVDGGAGIDTIVVGDNAVTTIAGLNASKNIEVAEFSAAATVTLGAAAGSLNNASITKLMFTAGANTVTDADAAHTYGFSGTAATGTLNLATAVSTANVSLEGVTLTTLTVTAATAADAVTVNMASIGTAANTVNVSAAAGSKFNVTGTQDLTFTTAANSVSVDASALTGKLVITGSTKADTIILGSGADTVNVQADGSTYTKMDSITNFSKVDTLTLDSVTFAAAADLIKFDASNSITFEQALLSAEQAITTPASQAAYFTFGGNTYIVANTDAGNNAIDTGSTDLVVKITGVQTLTADAAGIHAAA